MPEPAMEHDHRIGPEATDYGPKLKLASCSHCKHDLEMMKQEILNTLTKKMKILNNKEHSAFE